MSGPYNGHHCWNCWNVALWIGNDEPLYRAAMEAKQRPRKNGRPAGVNLAALRFMSATGLQNTRTPDGARYTFKAVKAALEGLE